VTGQTLPAKALTSEETVLRFDFLRGIGYFSWETPSRLFLVRRTVPFDFHLLSYSHVHEGWGSLGRMVEEFEVDPQRYRSERGYSCLTRDAVQRTLPFLGDIDLLKYEAAMAVPIYSDKDFQLRGAFLLYLAKKEYVPLHTGGAVQERLAEQFLRLNQAMNQALDYQERVLGVQDSATTICAKWKQLVQDRTGGELVIGRLELGYPECADRTKLLELCSRIQALLSGSDCFSVLDRDELGVGRAAILIAARYGLSFDDVRERALSAVGAAGENCGPLIYSCRQLRDSPMRRIGPCAEGARRAAESA